MEFIERCDNCGSPDSRLLFRGRDRLHGRPGEFTLVSCRKCGLIYLTPRPGTGEIGAYYPEDYVSFPRAIEEETSVLRRLDRAYGLHKRCREVIRRAGEKGKMLDVGCATGIFLDGMRRRGWETTGVEPTHSAAAYAREHLHLNVVEGYLEEAHFPDHSFDLVTLWDVLEHVPSPAATLAEINRILRPGGWLVLSLPNPEAWERYWFGRYWAGWDVPRHFHLFTRGTLQGYLERAGLEMVEVASFTGRHGVLVLSLQFWMTDWQTPPATKERIRRLAASLPARALTWPFYWVADRANKSSIMNVFARKPGEQP